MKVALENPSTDARAAFQRGFKTFIKIATYEMEHERPWVPSTSTRSAALCTIAWHPIWDLAAGIIATLPPGEYTTAAKKFMRTFDRIRQKIPPRTPTLPVEPSAEPDGLMTEEPQSYTTSPHIAINIGPDADEKNDVTGTVATSSDAPSAGDLEEDEGTDEQAEVCETEEDIDSAQEQPVTTTISPLPFPTSPINSPTLPSGPPPQWPPTVVDTESEGEDDLVTSAVVAEEFAGVAKAEKDADGHSDGMGKEITSGRERPTLDFIVTPFALPTPPIDSSASLPSPSWIC